MLDRRLKLSIQTSGRMRAESSMQLNQLQIISEDDKFNRVINTQEKLMEQKRL